MWRKKKSEKKVEMISFLSEVSIQLGNIVLEANKKHSVSKEIANKLKDTRTYKKWQIKFK